jgi:uncharacterized protein YceK
MITRRKVLIAVSAIVLLIAGISTIISKTEAKHGSTDPASTSGVDNRVKTSTRSSPAAETVPSSDSGQQNTVLDPNGPVTAAKAAMEALEQAQFLPRKRANAIVRDVVVPDEVANQELDLRLRAPAFAKSQLKYDSLAGAETSSNYSWVAAMGNLNLRGDTVAQITFFGTMSWLSPPDNQDRQRTRGAFDLRVVTMVPVSVYSNRQRTLKWMLLNWQELPHPSTATADGKPMSQAKAKKLFQPLIRNFQKL